MPEVFAVGLPSPRHITLDATRVYWAAVNDDSTQAATGAILSCPLSGGAPTTIAEKVDHPLAIAVDGTHVYWTEQTFSGRVMRVPLEGGVPEVVVPAIVLPASLALDEDSVYVTEYYGDGRVIKAPKTGGSFTVIGMGASPYGIVVKGGVLRWLEEETSVLHTIAPSVDPTSVVLTFRGPRYLAVDERFAWVTSWDMPNLYQTSLDTHATAVASLGTGDRGYALADGGSTIYWIGGTDVIAYTKQTGKTEIIATNQPGPIGITVNACAVYFTNSKSNEVMRVWRTASQ